VYRARGMAPAEAEEHAADVLATYTQHTVIAPPPSADARETHGTAVGAAAPSSLCFPPGARVPALPCLCGPTGLVAGAAAAGPVGVALLAAGATVGLLSGASPLTRALRQIAIGFGAAAATYVLGLVFGATVG